MLLPFGLNAPSLRLGGSNVILQTKFNINRDIPRHYEPACLKLDDVSFVDVDAGRIVKFTGDANQVSAIEDHYKTVADQFAIDVGVIDTWHAGIHPACSYAAESCEDPDRWSNSVFTNPRFLHFHTCGNYAPGEICLMVLDPTVIVDGVKLWDAGRLRS